MRNKFAGTCYRCGGHVAPGDGHFERFNSGWRTQHANCAIKFRGTPDPARQAQALHFLRKDALGTGKRAQNARRRLRDMEAAQPPIDPKDF